MSFPVLRSAHLCPVRSPAAGACDLVAVEPWGLDGDRHWMPADKAAGAVAQRQQPSMARISAEPLPGGGMLLSARPLCDHDDRPAHRRAGQGTPAHAGPPQAVRQAVGLRPGSDPRGGRE